MRISFCLSAALILLSFNLKAQYVDYGNDPARVKWRQIKTEHYRVIFPENNEVRANLYANILESAYPNVKFTLSSKRSNLVPVVLHPYNVHANGLVSWAPKRMELLPAPNFDSRFQIPEFSLSLHESRHVAQMDRLNQGIFRPFHFLLGEQAMGLAVLFVPEWFLEGEAVVAETALSSSGRGRSASFMMPYRAQVATGKNFSYDKWLMGSYKDFTHDFYALGYGMTSYARLKHGGDVWDRVLDRMTRTFPPLFAWPMSKYTGLSTKQLFDSTFSDLKKEWDLQIPQNPDKLTVLSPENKAYTSYLYPQETENGIICLKKSLYDIPAIVLIDSLGREKILTHTGIVNSKLTYSDGCVYWTEYISGLRWTHENYSIVKQLNINTKKVKNISRRSRYFAPAIFNDKQIAVFEHTVEGQNNVAIIGQNGKQIKSYPILYNLPVQDMVTDDSGNIFAAITGKGNGIFKLDTLSGKWLGYLSYKRTNIEALRLHRGQLIFESGYNGVNNIYAFDTLTLKIKRLTNSYFGSFAGTFAADGSKLYLSDYTAKGYKLASIDAGQLNEEFVSFKEPYKFKTAETLSSQEVYNIDDTSFDIKKYESKRYSKAANLFNVHSWFPVFYDVDEIRNDFGKILDFRPGVSLLSQNRLNTLTANVAYYYDLLQHSNNGFLSLKYTGLFPVFQLKMNVGGQRVLPENSQLSNQPKINAAFLMYLPFNFTDNHYIHGLQPYFRYRYTNEILPALDRHFQYLNSGISYFYYRNPAHRDIFPKFGWQAWLDYVGNPKLAMGQLFITKTNLYFPGIFRNHGLKTSFSYQHQIISESSKYYFPAIYADVARFGDYNYRAKDLFISKNDYSFPIFYPDWNLGSIVYLKRVRGNLFFDIMGGKSFGANISQLDAFSQSTCGFDLSLDLHFLRFQLAPASVTFRIAKPEKRDFAWDILFGMSI